MSSVPPHQPFRQGLAFGEAHVLFDMHVHSCYSHDSALSIRNIIRSYERHDILPLVCDHNAIAGSERVYAGLCDLDPGIPHILAEEITTSDGEIIGLFLNDQIRPFLSVEETLDAIRDQGGISIVPHPFCSFRSGAIRRAALDRTIGRIDIIEGFNARMQSDDENLRAQSYAARHGKPVSAGSDAHTFLELSRNYVILEPFFSPADLLRNLRQAEIRFHRTNPVIHYVTQIVRFARRKGYIASAD